MASLLALSPYGEDGCVRAIMETPKGSHCKYAYDPQAECLTLRKLLPEGMVFPYDFGFIPCTQAEDGDPLDVLLLLDESLPPLCLVDVRVLGAITAKERSDGETKWTRNDRLIACSRHSHQHAHLRSLDDLRPKQLEEIKKFFEVYNREQGKTFKSLKDVGPKKALKLVNESVGTYKKAN